MFAIRLRACRTFTLPQNARSRNGPSGATDSLSHFLEVDVNENVTAHECLKLQIVMIFFLSTCAVFRGDYHVLSHCDVTSSLLWWVKWFGSGPQVQPAPSAPKWLFIYITFYDPTVGGISQTINPQSMFSHVVVKTCLFAIWFPCLYASKQLWFVIMPSGFLENCLFKKSFSVHCLNSVNE